MWTRNATQASAPLLPTASVGAPLPASSGTSAKAFSQVLQQTQVHRAAPGSVAGQSTAPAAHTIAAGDTLIGLVRDQAQARGVQINGAQEMRLAQQLANANGIANANLVFPGETIQLSSIHADLQNMPIAAARSAEAAAQTAPPSAKASLTSTAPAAPTAVRSAAGGYQARPPQFTPAAQAASKTAIPTPAAGTAHPVLQQTLDRAVAKGFIPAVEKTAVFDKILQMAQNHRFAPDDFARMTLMESDGMNPRASNQRCHGIIQFCDGPARGAASAGYAANPKAILDLSVHKQLSLVDKYFDDVGLKNQGPAGLEDLYLSVLNPASRAQTRSNAPLNIGGQQARALYVDSDTSAPITRQSIRQGLLQNAATRLGQMLPPTLRVQAQRAQQYVENNLP
jgi:hypothetical protein